MIDITMLGTSCMVPTKERNVSGIFLRYKDTGILLDCGEGTQRQMNICGIKRTALNILLVSHWHGDHISGFIGLVQTMEHEGGPKIIRVFGPRGSKIRMNHLLSSCVCNPHMDIRVEECFPKIPTTIYETDEFAIEAVALDHSADCVGFSFIQKPQRRIDTNAAKRMGLADGPWMRELSEGRAATVKGTRYTPEQVTYVKEGKKVTYVADTRLCKAAIELAKNADLVIAEATYTEEYRDKAAEHGHMTAKEAATVASRADAKKLVLTHFSQRYKNMLEIQSEAEHVFPKVVCAEDFMRFEL